MDVNEALASYRAANQSERPARELALIKSLKKYATSIIWLKLHEDRPDLVNEAVSEVMLYLPKFNGNSKFSTWAYTIVERLCCRELSVTIERRRTERSFSDFEDHQVESLASYELNDDARTTLDALRKGLSGEEDELIELRLQGHSSVEIAKRLNTTPTTIDKRLQRLFGKLRKIERKRQVTATSLKLRRKSFSTIKAA